jgi:hypothetical protein
MERLADALLIKREQGHLTELHDITDGAHDEEACPNGLAELDELLAVGYSYIHINTQAYQ